MTTTSLLSGLKVYVGTYAKYNNGSIEGDWLDLEDYTDKDSFLAACAELHADETDPELMFQDAEGMGNLYSESSMFDFWELADSLESAGVDNLELYLGWCSNMGYDVVDSADTFADAYCGEQSESDFAYDIVQEMLPSDAPDFLTRYFDYDAFERDLFMTDYTSIDGHIFRNV